MTRLNLTQRQRRVFFFLCKDEIDKKKGVVGSRKDLKTAMEGGWEALGTDPTVLK